MQKLETIKESVGKKMSFEWLKNILLCYPSDLPDITLEGCGDKVVGKIELGKRNVALSVDLRESNGTAQINGMGIGFLTTFSDPSSLEYIVSKIRLLDEHRDADNLFVRSVVLD